MDQVEPDVLACMSFPAAHRPRLHSANPIERLNGEIKRRTEVPRVGLRSPEGRLGIFPNEARWRARDQRGSDTTPWSTIPLALPRLMRSPISWYSRD
jgi:hypothetical protein